MYIGTIFSFLAPHVFEERLERMYLYGVPDISDREGCLSYCQILMIFAFGQMYSVNQWMGHDGPPGFAYFMQALQFLPELHEEGSVLFVEVLSLVGYFMQTLNRRDAAFLYVSRASKFVRNSDAYRVLDWSGTTHGYFTWSPPGALRLDLERYRKRT